MAVNRGALEAFRVAGKRRLYRLTEETRGKNGAQFMELKADEWFANCGELCIAVPKNADGSYWAEPEHMDGGASVLHLGLTLWPEARAVQSGRRPARHLHPLSTWLSVPGRVHGPSTPGLHEQPKIA